MRQLVLCLVLFALVAGCAPWTPMHRLSLGMSKSQVLQTLGKPNNASGQGQEEYLWYVPVNMPWKRFYVRLVDGRVEAYGPVGKEKAKP